MMIRAIYRKLLYKDLDKQYVEYLAGKTIRNRKDDQAAMIDIGCGWGFNLIPYYLDGYLCYALDNSEVALSKISQHLPGVLTLQQDASEEIRGFPPGFFDLMLCTHLLEHLENDAFCLNEMYRLLAEGGKIVIKVPHKNNWYSKVFGKTDRTHLREYTYESLSELLKDVPHTPIVHNGWFPPVGLKVSNLIQKLFPIFSVYAFIGKYDKKHSSELCVEVIKPDVET